MYDVCAYKQGAYCFVKIIKKVQRLLCLRLASFCGIFYADTGNRGHGCFGHREKGGAKQQNYCDYQGQSTALIHLGYPTPYFKINAQYSTQHNLRQYFTL